MKPRPTQAAAFDLAWELRVAASVAVDASLPWTTYPGGPMAGRPRRARLHEQWPLLPGSGWSWGWQ